MKKNILVAIFIFLCFQLNAQNFQSKYILLGEPTHGDGTVFDEKVKIIKKLHKENQFKTILFEAGFYDNYKVWELLKIAKDFSLYSQSIFPIWSETKAFQELIDYVQKNPDMKILGIDCQEGEIFQNYYLNDLKGFLKQNNIYFTEDEFQIIDKTLIYKDLEYLKNNKTEIQKLHSVCNKFLTALASIKNKDFKGKVIEQAFKSSKAEVDYMLTIINGDKFSVQNPRDKQMAENFIFLQKELKNEKLLLWAANYHIANDLSTFKMSDISLDYIKRMHVQEKNLTGHNESSLDQNLKNINELKDAVSMGKILKDYYKDELFSLAFTAYSGNYLGQHDTVMPILTPPLNSLESDLFSKNSPTVLVDLKEYPKNEFYSSTLGYFPILMKWKNVYDGIFYIPKMHPPEKITYKKALQEEFKTKNNSKIKGKIMSLENIPISYADVYYKSNKKSVVANENGEFYISKSPSLDDYLVFSAMGYQSDSIQVKNSKSENNIYLKPSSEKIISIEEVILKGKKLLSAKEILEKAKDNVTQNYIQTPYNQKFYVSEQRYNDKDILKYNEEALIEIFYKNGLNSSNSPENNIFGEILQYKSQTENSAKNKESGIGNLWTQLNRDIILSKANVLYRTSSYDLTENKIVDYDGKRVYKISFINNSPGVYSTGYGYPAPESSTGTIYIDSKNFAVIRYEHCIVRKTHQYKNSKYPSQTFHKIIQTYKESDGKYFLNFYKQIDKSNYLNEGKVISTFYGNFYLMSEDITLNIVKKYAQPIMKIKNDFSPKTNNEFWENNNFYIEDKDYKFENCNFK
ncbi:erythromycin esterase family protein [Chryseobacterium turcicum]|uniref:Erythromycin esterase family protein n=1 Tax=Chryseobacterium turcicum TaxID=2898076 RepID=A0A9Q3V6Q8_9FLAO|nr:erythromycin esterase family protein [Chryseobacterium turcicum]MCD1118431.1 erythromycin esterase family protein [Chryseobacterium turcicum]